MWDGFGPEVETCLSPASGELTWIAGSGRALFMGSREKKIKSNTLVLTRNGLPVIRGWRWGLDEGPEEATTPRSPHGTTFPWSNLGTGTL